MTLLHDFLLGNEGAGLFPAQAVERPFFFLPRPTSHVSNDARMVASLGPRPRSFPFFAPDRELFPPLSRDARRLTYMGRSAHNQVPATHCALPFACLAHVVFPIVEPPPTGCYTFTYSFPRGVETNKRFPPPPLSRKPGIYLFSSFFYRIHTCCLRSVLRAFPPSTPPSR